MSDINASLLGRNPLPNPKLWWQKRAFNIGVALLGLLMVIAIMTINVAKYESHLADGDIVLLALAPVDPRGFMQGDYMTLSYALERDIFNALPAESNDNVDNDEENAKLEAESLESDNAAIEADTLQAKANSAAIKAGEFESETAAFEATQIEADARFEAEAQRFEQNFQNHKPSAGYVIVRIDNNNIGHFARLADSNNDDKLAKNEMAIQYRVRNNRVKLATNAFFFQEGQAEAFEAAEYGLFRVNDKGEPLLTNMVDGEFEVIVGVNSEGEQSLESLNNMGRQGSGM